MRAIRRLGIVALAVALGFGGVGTSTVAARSRADLPGWSRTCVAPNWITGAPEAIADRNVHEPNSGFWGYTTRMPGGHWDIKFNTARIFGPGATPAVLKFLFYHECAHARFGTGDERVADCGGLQAMRADIGVSESDLREIAATYASVGRSFPTGGPC